ncbi:MAG: hypothetical protein HZC41_05190 [Chloroflexi bacterium]|nr:hypothetical protein [Chloroflexota bacterium]
MSAQAHLKQSNAGMRLIALLTLYNQGDFDRLSHYIGENYAPAALVAADAVSHLADWRERRAVLGKLRVEQVVAIGKHQAVVVVQAQQDGSYHALQIAVEEDFPHRVTLVAWGAVEEENEPPGRQERQEESE